jgi:hypothetical protein
MTRVMALMMALSIGCSSSDRAGAKQCEELREHLVDLALAESTGIDRGAHREAMRAALGDAFVESCSSSLSEDQVDCGLRASDVSGATSCTR